MLDRLVLARRDDYDRGNPPMAGEVDRANELAAQWAAEWFTPADATAWLDQHRGIAASVAAALTRAGL